MPYTACLGGVVLRIDLSGRHFENFLAVLLPIIRRTGHQTKRLDEGDRRRQVVEVIA